MLRFVEKRGIRTDQTPPARTEVLSARGEESKPVAHPCRGPVAKPEITRSGRVTDIHVGATRTYRQPGTSNTSRDAKA